MLELEVVRTGRESEIANLPNALALASDTYVTQCASH